MCSSDLSQQNKIFSFQSQVWGQGPAAAANDFEAVVFEQHNRLAILKRGFLRAGAETAIMTGSGSAVYGMFPTREQASRALESLGKEETFRISLVRRARYRSIWWRALEEHITGRTWPPRSQYAR